MSRRPRNPASPNDEFVMLVNTALVWKLRASYRLSKHDAEDAAAAAIIRLVPKVATVISAYPSAQVYALAVARSAAEDFQRTQRAQRGEGARLVADRDDPGRLQTKRSVVALDDSVAGPADPHDVERDVTTSSTLQQLLSGLEPRERWLIWAVEIGGYTVTDAAAVLGISREQASRGRSAIRARLRALHSHLDEAA